MTDEKRRNMFKNLGEILFNKAKSVNDKIDAEKIEKLYSIATNKAKSAAAHGNFSVNVTINTREYDYDCPFFDFIYDSPSLIDKVVPEVMKRLNNEHEVSHWIMTLNFGAKDIADNDYDIKLHPIPHEV